MLNTIHNLHYYQTVMRELRAAIESCTLTTHVAQFHADRAREAR